MIQVLGFLQSQSIKFDERAAYTATLISIEEDDKVQIWQFSSEFAKKMFSLNFEGKLGFLDM